MPNKLSPAERVKRAERIRQVMALYTAGATFEAIGRQLGIHRATAYKLWRVGLKGVYKETAEEALVQYDLRTRQCIRLHATIMADPKVATVTKIRAADSLARTEFQRSQVLGFGRALKTELSGAVTITDGAHEQLLDRLARLTAAAAESEGDPEPDAD